MLRRARNRLKSDRPRFVVADLTRLPFADASFDCVTCGYVLEHLPDARVGLAGAEPGDGARRADVAADHRRHVFGRWTSRMWCCRTYNRRELAQICEEVGLALAPRTVVHADAQSASRRRHLRGIGEGCERVARCAPRILSSIDKSASRIATFLVHRQDFLLTIFRGTV